MHKKYYYAANFIIFFILIATFLLTTNWLYLLHERFQFDLKLDVLKIVWSWRFLINGGDFEVLFNILIGPAFLITFFLCRKKKYMIPYLFIIAFSIILVHECYSLTHFKIALPSYQGNTRSIYKDLIPLNFFPYYFEFGTLLVLQLYLFYQSKENYHLIIFNKEYVSYLVFFIINLLLVWSAIVLLL